MLAANVFEILPARVRRQVGDDAAELAATDAWLSARRRGSIARRRLPAIAAAAASAVVRVGAIASGFTTTLAALGMLHYDALAHEALAIKILDSVFSVTRVLELDKSKRAHDADIVETLRWCKARCKDEAVNERTERCEGCDNELTP